MSNLPNHLPLPLAGFVRRLRAAGFAVDAGREFQLRRVLHEQGAEYIGRFEELKYALAPYVATNASEQRRFYRLWDDYLVSLEAQLVEKPEAAPPAGWRKWAKQLRYLLVSTILISLLLLAWNLARNKGPIKPEPFMKVELQQEAEARAGQPLQIQNMTLLEAARDSINFVWSIRDVETGNSLHRQDSFELHYVVPDTMVGRSLRIVLWAQQLVSETELGVDTLTLAVLCGEPPVVPSLDALPPKVLQGESWTLPKLQSRPSVATRRNNTANSEVVLGLLINGTLLEETPEEYVFSEEGQTKVQLLVQRVDDLENCFALSPPRTVQVGSNVPVIPTIPLKRDIPRQILQAGNWLYLFPLLIGFGLYLLHRRKWRKKEEDTREKTDDELAEEYPFHDVGPYVIPYQDQTGQISVPADFYRIADQLRVREAGLRMSFDGKATVEATVREGGFPSWRERAVKRPANYLVLLRHTDEFQQQDRLLKRLTDFLLVREAELDVYYHGGDFVWFWNEAHPKGWSPAQMTGRYGEHRLIILGDGHGLVDAFHRRKPRLEPTKERWLMKWSRRLLLTTEPAVDWSFQEVLLHKDLLLYPATTNGILRGVADLNQVEEYQGSSYTRWKAERFRRNPEPSHRYRTWKTVDDHRDYLANDPELFRWLAALAVAPNPNWSLTIAIGRALGLNVTHDRLLQLSRIPWLAVNAPDQDLRLAFLAELPIGDEQLARTAALEQLEAVSGEVENTFAESEWTANQAVQSFALAPTETGNQSKIRDLRRMGMLTPDQLAELNQVAERQFPVIKGRRNMDGDESYLDELLNPPVKAGEILNKREKELLGLIVGCLLMFLPMYLYNMDRNELPPGETKSFWQELENPTDDAHRALEKNNLAATQSNLLDRGNGYMRSADNKAILENRIESALDSALLLRGQNYPLVDSNLAAFQLNRLAYTLNWVAADSALLGPMLNEDIQDLFEKADAAIADKFPKDSFYILQRLHAEGMYEWLSFKSIQITAEDKSGAVRPWIDALRLKSRIDTLHPTFFDNLADSMPVNLAYLLANEPRPTFEFDGRIITGKVLDQDGEPVFNAEVRLGGSNTKTSTDIDGGFSLGLTRGKGYLEVSLQNVETIEVSLLLPDGEFKPNSAFNDIVLNVPEGIVGPGLGQQELKKVTGRVVGPNGKGLSGVIVIETSQGGDTKTDQQGSYVLTLNGTPSRVRLVFETDGVRQERTYTLGSESLEDLGEIMLAERQTPDQTPDPINNTLRGKVVDGAGAPIIGASVLLVGTTIGATTDIDGNFSLQWDGSAGAVEVSYLGFSTQSIGGLVNRGGGLLRNDLGNISMKVEVSAPGTETEKELTGILGDFGERKYSRVVASNGNEAVANDFIQAVTRELAANNGRRGFLSGDMLINGLANRYGEKLEISDRGEHTNNSEFLFFGPSIRIPRLARQIDQIKSGSEALIFTTTEIKDPSFGLTTSLAPAAAKLTEELRTFGFNVRHIINPTKEEMMAALERAAHKEYKQTDQLLIMFNNYSAGGGEVLFLSDAKFGEESTYLKDNEQREIVKNFSTISHLLIVANFMNLDHLFNQPQGNPQQTSEPQPYTAKVQASVLGKPIGSGVAYQPRLTLRVENPGTVVAQVCIDSKGKVTSVNINEKASKNYSTSTARAIEENLRRWTFNISVNRIQPNRECGEVVFQIK